jgi:hypothetical protein
MSNARSHRGTAHPGRSSPAKAIHRAGEHLERPSNRETDPTAFRVECRRLHPDCVVESLAGELARLLPHQQVEVLQALAEVYRKRAVDPTFAVDPDPRRGCLDLVAAIVRDAQPVPEVFLPDRRWQPPRQAAR